MADERPAHDEVRLRACLRALSNDEGTKRTDDDLKRLLTKEAPELLEVWHIDLANGVEAARDTIEWNLSALVTQLTPRPARQELTPEQRATQYRHGVAVGFNITSHSGLSTMKLLQRRDWLSTTAVKPFKIPPRTSQRDLQYAIEQIAQRLADPGYKPPPPDNRLREFDFTSSEEDKPDTTPVAIATRPSRLRLFRSWKTAGVLGAVLLVELTVIFWPRPNSTPPPQTSAGGTQTAIDIALKVSNTYITDITQGSSLAFPVGGSAAKDYTDGLVSRREGSSAYANMAAGGYAVGGVELDLYVEGNDPNHEVTITNISPVNITRLPAITGDLVYMPNSGTGGLVERLGFVLDEVNPTAKQVKDDRSYDDKSYFSLIHPSFPYKASQWFTLDFAANASAFEFDVAIDYMVEGKSHRMLLERDGKPVHLRASANLCEGKRLVPVAPVDLKYLEGKRYGKVTEIGSSETGFELRNIDPEKYWQTCGR
jgi:hypothetical protein